MKDKVCYRCNKKYTPTGRNQMFCEPCGVIHEKESDLSYYYRQMADPKKRAQIQAGWRKRPKGRKAEILKNIKRDEDIIWRAEERIKMYKKELKKISPH